MIEKMNDWLMICRRYYFAFLLSEAINNAGGLGFNGLDAKGQPKWDLLTNITPFRLEKATSLKVVLDSWNIRKANSSCEDLLLIDFF